MRYDNMTEDNLACGDGILLETSRAPAHSFSNPFLCLLEELCERSNLKAMSSRNVFQMDLSHHFCSSWHT